jgi:hypothetical protein
MAFKSSKIWTQEVTSTQQNQVLQQLTPTTEPIKWRKVCLEFNKVFPTEHRTAKQCRDRWRNYLNPALNYSPWTAEESEVLFFQHKTIGNKWTLYTDCLPGRSENSIKNHFYSTVRKNIRRYNLNLPNSLKIRMSVNQILQCREMEEVFCRPKIDKKELKDMKEMVWKRRSQKSEVAYGNNLGLFSEEWRQMYMELYEKWFQAVSELAWGLQTIKSE